MRRGRENGFLFVDDKEDNKLIGISLGWDFVSEHEWGIKGLQSAFGIPAADDDKFGLDKRTITKVPAAPLLTLNKAKTGCTLLYSRGGNVTLKQQSEYIKHLAKKGDLTTYGEHTLATAWDGESFGARTIAQAESEHLAEIYAALQRKDAAIWIAGNGGNPFARGGLVIAIVSRVPADKAQIMYNADADADRLKRNAADTGIEERLRAAGKSWFSLHPRWTRPGEASKVGTRECVMFWLNPRDQNAYHHGWFTVEELEQWIEGKGPVMK